jgi:hypothetical protein
MNRLLICTAIGLFLGLTPALALDDATTAPGADTSSGAAQQSSHLLVPNQRWTTKG